MHKQFEPLSTGGVHEALGDTGLHDYIADEARRHSRNPVLQEDFRQEAWLWISISPNDASMDLYRWVAFRAIQNAYYKEKGENHMSFEEVFSELSH